MPPREAPSLHFDNALHFDYEASAFQLAAENAAAQAAVMEDNGTTLFVDQEDGLNEMDDLQDEVTDPNNAQVGNANNNNRVVGHNVDPLSIDLTQQQQQQTPNINAANAAATNYEDIEEDDSLASTSSSGVIDGNALDVLHVDQLLFHSATVNHNNNRHHHHLTLAALADNVTTISGDTSHSDLDTAMLMEDISTFQLASGSNNNHSNHNNSRPIHPTATHNNNNTQQEIHQRHIRTIPRGNIPPPTPTFRFDSRNTSIDDLRYFAERGCIVPLLAALDTPRLVTLGARMLADYAKKENRRVAVASNHRILEFLMTTMNKTPSSLQEMQSREFAVECVRSLTATEESDPHLMKCRGMLLALAKISSEQDISITLPFLSIREVSSFNKSAAKARLHACISFMNLSCGKPNKVIIANTPTVVSSLVKVLNLDPLDEHVEAILKGVTCIKNLSNADQNDAILLSCEGLIEALGSVARRACLYHADTSILRLPEENKDKDRAHQACTNACLALMNLSINKGNKYKVFTSQGIMDALMCVLEHGEGEARVKACSALSNLAIGYTNKVPMLQYKNFVPCILKLIHANRPQDGLSENEKAIRQAIRTKACSILWSFAAESKNQIPVVQRGDILPVLVDVAREDTQTEARFKCIAALTLLAESPENALPLLKGGALEPLMEILSQAGPDPTRWVGQTPSWCVGFLMNLSQSYHAVPSLREAGVIELLTPFLSLDHYQSLKAAMAITFILAHPTSNNSTLYGIHTPLSYDLLRKIENVIPKIVSLLTNTLSGKGGNGYKYGVFTLRSSVGCISSLSSFPDFIKGYLCTPAVIAGLCRVVANFCVNGGSDATIVGGGREDQISSILAVRALHEIIGYLIPNDSCTLFYSLYSHNIGAAGDRSNSSSNSASWATHPLRTNHSNLERDLIHALESFEKSPHAGIDESNRQMSRGIVTKLYSVLSNLKGQNNHSNQPENDSDTTANTTDLMELDESNSSSFEEQKSGSPKMSQSSNFFGNSSNSSSTKSLPTLSTIQMPVGRVRLSLPGFHQASNNNSFPTTSTFIVTDRDGKQFTVPYDPTGGRSFNDNVKWCYRRGRFCRGNEEPDESYVWTNELQMAYEAVLNRINS